MFFVSATMTVHRPMTPRFRLPSAGLLCLAVSSAFAAGPARTLADCARITDDMRRLACFDEVAANSLLAPPSDAARTPDATPRPGPFPNPSAATGHAASAEPPAASPPPATASRSRLAEHWETQPENKRGTFTFRPHQRNYLLFAKRSSNPNDAPYEPFRSLAPENEGISRTELSFQLGFKMKLAEDLTRRHADLWFGYTQQSFWQAYSRRVSSPFRETNYQPELMFVVPTGFRMLGMTNEFINFGLVHQSNGQPSTLSRSWNRWYVQTGLEQGKVSLVARVWKRIKESRDDDDNPDIQDYLGHGDLLATWRSEGHLVSVLVRRNFSTDRGALQVGWAFPVSTHLKGYVQAFTGYGESLIDYNARQSTLGIGVLIDW